MTNKLPHIFLFVFLFCALAVPALQAAPPLYDGKPGAQAGQQCVNPKDKAVMVWVPAGQFLLGSAATEKDATPDEKPQRKVTMDGFWVYQTPVTVAQYKAYCTAMKQAMPKDAPKLGTLAMVFVNWTEASGYATWAGAALPSEAQWEMAARGTDGRMFPWGEKWDPEKVNLAADNALPVGSFPADASPYGCLDMEGNVLEWCADWYNDQYYVTAPDSNPKGPETGKMRVQRGGPWNGDIAFYFRCTNRSSGAPEDRVNLVGFRCVVIPAAP